MGSIKNITQEYMSSGQAAKRLGRNSASIRRAVKSKKLKAFTLNGELLIKVSDFEEYLANNLLLVKVQPMDGVDNHEQG